MFTSLRLERFKNFKDAELKLGPFTVLIGANASGKSNIRDGFRFLHGVARGYSLADIIGEKHGEGGERIWSGIRGGAREIAYSGERSFSLTCQTMISAEMAQQIAWPHRIGENSLDRDIGEESLIYEVEVEVKPRASTSRIIAESLELARGYNVFVSKFTNLYNHSVTLYPDSKQFAVGPYILPRTMPFLGQLPMEVRNWPAGSVIWTGREADPQLLKEGILHLAQVVDEPLEIYRSNRYFDWSLDAIRQPSLPGQDILGDNGRNLSSVLLEICRDAREKQNLLSWIRTLTPMDAADFEFPTDPAGRVLATLIEQNKQKITLASASDGTLRFLAFLAAFLGPRPSSFYFLEELENGIHPTRLSLLLDLIENQVKDRNIQVVATTHSPQLLGCLSKESLENASLVYRLPDESEGRIIRVLDIPHARRLIRKYRQADLLASGWFEDTVHYMQPDPDATPVPATAVPPRRRQRPSA